RDRRDQALRSRKRAAPCLVTTGKRSAASTRSSAARVIGTRHPWIGRKARGSMNGTLVAGVHRLRTGNDVGNVWVDSGLGHGAGFALIATLLAPDFLLALPLLPLLLLVPLIDGSTHGLL